MKMERAKSHSEVRAVRKFLGWGIALQFLVLNVCVSAPPTANAQNYGEKGQSEASETETPSTGADSSMEPSSPTGVQPADIPPGEAQPTESSSNSTDEGTAPLPNADAMSEPTRTFGPTEIPGYSEAMESAQNPAQAKGNKQLLESLRDVFPVNGNPLKDLFTPQPQYVTNQTLMNPQPTNPKPGESNPLKGLFTPQPQYMTPQTLINPEPTPPAGELNHFKGVFTAQPQYPTPQTMMNPHPLPRYYVKERMPDHFFVQQGQEKGAQQGKVETPLGPSKASENVAESKEHPLRKAMLLINSAHEDDAIGLMDRLLVQYPGNFQAHYVKAVALVRLRRYGDAREEYRKILQFSADPALKNLAQEGMTKLEVSKMP